MGTITTPRRSDQTHPRASRLHLFFIGVAALVLAFGVFEAGRAALFASRSVEVTATVVARTRSIFTVQYVVGTTRARADLHRPRLPRLSRRAAPEPASVRIRVLRTAPLAPRLASFESLWLEPALVTGGGALALAVALATLPRRRR